MPGQFMPGLMTVTLLPVFGMPGLMTVTLLLIVGDRIQPLSVWCHHEDCPSEA